MASLPKYCSRMPERRRYEKQTHTPTKEKPCEQNDRPKARHLVRIFVPFVMLLIGCAISNGRRFRRLRRGSRLGRGGLRATEAATIMPLDSTPRNLRGARLTTTATLRPINFSGS